MTLFRNGGTKSALDGRKICRTPGRHYFAHRQMKTSTAVRDLTACLGILNIRSAEYFIHNGRPGTGVRIIIDDWLADVETFSDLAA